MSRDNERISEQEKVNYEGNGKGQRSLKSLKIQKKILKKSNLKTKGSIYFANENVSFICCPQILHWKRQRMIPQCHLWFYSHLQFASSILYPRLRVLFHLETAGREAFNLYLESRLAFALCFCYFYKIFFGCLVCGWRKQRVQQQVPITRSLLYPLLHRRDHSGSSTATGSLAELKGKV